MDVYLEDLIKILMAVVIGGLIGAEREYQDKAAGFRTMILITLGATLFTIFSIRMDPGESRTRIAANIVTGIGFLGAGTIIREGGRIAGLTTAATIWLASALGMGIGAGELWFVLAASGITLVVLWLFRNVEGWIDGIRESRSYRIVVAPGKLDKITEINRAFRTYSLRTTDRHQVKAREYIICSWRAIGSPKNHERFIQKLVNDRDIRELDY